MSRGSPHRPEHPALLDRVIAGALDADYEMVARRRAEQADGGPGRGRGARAATAAVIGAFVVLVVAAGLENRQNEPADALVRETLVSTATERRDALAELQAELATTREENADLATRGARAAEDRESATARLRVVGAASGFQAVTGPGLRIVVDDAPEEQGGELVRSDDLALLIDGLWEAGAEAISVGGERLTARSAITTANVSVNVNRRPLTAPYEVTAVGDPGELEEALGETQGGGGWLLLTERFGFGYEVSQSDDLELPAARDLLLTTCGACSPEIDDPTQRGNNP